METGTQEETDTQMTPDDQEATRAIVREEISAAETRLSETMRDMQSGILRCFAAFA
jgi:tripartite-type tricarboxylate transporter receptor subunit TctC